ncbi:MAG: metal-sensing transcriptional repressor [Erysipelothrix sp.]|nr:metal-sensing transcriptional repressor [Erysipelothrix sp.]
MKCDVKTKNRVKRLNGQMQGVLNMMEEERSCDEIVTQLSAIRTSVDRIISLITTQNLIETIEEQHDIALDDIDDALKLLIKSN